MKMVTLLMIDALINLALGISLILFPFGLARVLGVPVPESAFYPSVLGAVLIGIGLALLLEGLLTPESLKGLGPGGAITINICGAIALVAWLVNGKLDLPLRGYIILWALVGVLLGISTLEGFVKIRIRER